MYIKHSFQKKQEIIKLYQEGFGSNIIASRFNISKSHVKNLIKRFKYHGEEELKRLPHPDVRFTVHVADTFPTAADDASDLTGEAAEDYLRFLSATFGKGKIYFASALTCTTIP